MRMLPGKNFIAAALILLLALAGLALVSARSGSSGPAEAAASQPAAATEATPAQATAPQASQATESESEQLGSIAEAYRAGYRDGQADCAATRPVARRYYSRARVAGVSYAAPRRVHSTRRMVLTIAAPAAIGAGIGGIAAGKKGAGIGALLGGGGGALYHLIKDRDSRR